MPRRRRRRRRRRPRRRGRVCPSCVCVGAFHRHLSPLLVSVCFVFAALAFSLWGFWSARGSCTSVVFTFGFPFVAWGCTKRRPTTSPLSLCACAAGPKRARRHLRAVYASPRAPPVATDALHGRLVFFCGALILSKGPPWNRECLPIGAQILQMGQWCSPHGQ